MTNFIKTSLKEHNDPYTGQVVSLQPRVIALNHSYSIQQTSLFLYPESTNHCFITILLLSQELNHALLEYDYHPISELPHENTEFVYEHDRY